MLGCQLSIFKSGVNRNSHRSDCHVLGGFNCPNVNWVTNTALPNTADSQLLHFTSDSSLHQCVPTPTFFLSTKILPSQTCLLLNSHILSLLSLSTLRSVNLIACYYAGHAPLLISNPFPFQQGKLQSPQRSNCYIPCLRVPMKNGSRMIYGLPSENEF